MPPFPSCFPPWKEVSTQQIYRRPRAQAVRTGRTHIASGALCPNMIKLTSSLETPCCSSKSFLAQAWASHLFIGDVMARVGLELCRAGNGLRELPEVAEPVWRAAGLLWVVFISENVASGRMAHLPQSPQRGNHSNQGLVTQSVKWVCRLGVGEAIPQVTAGLQTRTSVG